MAEASKRSWPWRKKAQDKVASGTDSIESSFRASPINSSFSDEQDVSRILSDHARVSDEAITQWQQSESKLKQLSDKLTAAQTELSTKDILVKQHAKVAEEAVTGWEKAEADAAMMKQQLDTTMHQKLATEDRVCHLDGALKECMKQLRHVREEQEQRIHETMVEKTREYDKLRLEMEAKLTEVGHHLQDARSDADEFQRENYDLSNALQDRIKALVDVSDAKASAETEIKNLQAQLDHLQKENSSYKYEILVLSKEVQIRSEEREYERKAAENANRNQLENVKKIAKLEAECQRLRLLVRKKLPGPAALAQMKIEVDALGGNHNSFDLKRRRSLGGARNGSSPRDQSFPAESLHDNSPTYNGVNKEAEVLQERLHGIEDEVNMLKEALSKRDGELQSSRLMCAKTASKLSNVEEQLAAALKLAQGKSVSTWVSSQKERPITGREVVDPWNAGPGSLAGLDELREASVKGLDVGKLDLMDDFAEMERLAMATEKGELDNQVGDELRKDTFTEIAAMFEEKLSVKEKALEQAKHMCKEVSQKLAYAEEQLANTQSRNRVNEAALVTLQEKLDRLCDIQGEDDGVKDRTITKELEDLIEAQSMTLRSGAVNEANLYEQEEGSQNGGEVHNGVGRRMSSGSSSEVRYEANEDVSFVLSDAESKASTRDLHLLTSIRRVVQAVESLAQATGSEHELCTSESQLQDSLVTDRQVFSFKQWKNLELDSTMRRLIGTGNKVLQGETDIIEFLAELTAIVNCLVDISTRNFNQMVERKEDQAGDGNLSEKERKFGRFCPDQPEDCHVNVDRNGVGALEEDLDNSKRGKMGVERCVQAAQTRLEGANNHSQETEKLMTDVHDSNGQMESEPYELDRDLRRLQQKVVVLEEELQDERGRHDDMVTKYLELQQKIHSGDAGSDSSAGSLTSEISGWGVPHNRHDCFNGGETQVRKDQEIQSAADKLAECQRSILDLGKQLKALSSPGHAEETKLANYAISDLHVRTPSGFSTDDMTPWSSSGGNSVPGSPSLDRRRFTSCNPPLAPRMGLQNSSQYPLLSHVSRPISHVKKENGYHSGNELGNSTPIHHYGGLMIGTASPAASELSLFGSLSVPGSPARSPAAVLSFRPGSNSPMRTSISKSSSGNVIREVDSDSSTTSLSRFHVSTKSCSDL